MPKLPRLTLKSFFEKGDKPSQGQFAALLDSAVLFIDDKDIIGLRLYSTTRFYSAGDTVVYLDSVYLCLGDTSGSFDPPKWKNLVAFGAVIYLGAWDALINDPPLATGAGTKGTYYVVSVSGSTNLDGITDWKAGDWAIFNGVAWEKVDNTEDQVAADIAFTPNGDITSTNVQDAIVEVRDDTDDKLDDKADKVAGATSGDIATLTASGNLSDSGFTLTDFLSKINTIPYTPSTDYNPATKKYVDDTATALGVPNKADKVTGAVNDNFAALDAGGNLKDSLKSPADYLAKDNAVVYSPSTDYNPATKLYVDDGLDLKQDLDPTLTALAGLATGADQLPYSTGTDTFSQTPLTAFARTVLDDADA
ncbi:MAG: major tail fiber protein [Bacteroidetes bacterium]|nr:MAG: major tail fiber protein [Bacteroidota bacterium]